MYFSSRSHTLTYVPLVFHMQMNECMHACMHASIQMFSCLVSSSFIPFISFYLFLIIPLYLCMYDVRTIFVMCYRMLSFNTMTKYETANIYSIFDGAICILAWKSAIGQLLYTPLQTPNSMQYLEMILCKIHAIKCTVSVVCN